MQTIASPLQRITCSQLTVQQLQKTATGLDLVSPCLDSLFPVQCSDKCGIIAVIVPLDRTDALSFQ